MHWYTVPGAFVGLVAFVGVVRRVIVRPARRSLRTGRELAQQIRDAGATAHDLAALAGAVTHFAAAFMEELRDNRNEIAAHDERLDDLAELLTDSLADIARLKKAG